MRAVTLIIAALVAGLVLPRPVAAVEWSGRYNVYTPGSFSSQINNYSCVGASVQMMLNLIYERSDQSADRQRTYWRYAQRHSRYPVTDNGADPAGWVRALENWGAGDYRVGRGTTMQQALWGAAIRMRRTGKPVGLLVAAGRHAWVMTGFQATADPARTWDFKVTAVQAMGSLWPYGTINGRAYDPGPKTWISVSDLKVKFTPYRMPYSDAWNGRWITVIP